ncbi:Electron transport complex protein RnfG [Thioalkalivibrio nitratireducens DSM 14787]|uniref:Ion-translocating oxidoreductase complex subunit G n=1 Tax=Thioalkalivibrio nitratireducens (strain DSM 14787 / UNIQEM 213 / ALEN2) TaxID=1255043 RepID=L0E074_THIND|nr:Electron transport complex protein RnfG [Thioalkalivibrio nitratireducens DSM 14787]
MIITTLLLGLFAAAGTGLVAWVHSGTEARIAENRLAVTRLRVTAALEGLDYDNDPVGDHTTVSDPLLGGEDLPVWFARKGDDVVGLVLSAVTAQGYSGNIHLLVGLDTAGNLLGVRVTQHRETPGLGDDIEVDRSDWILGFRGRSLENPPIELWRVRRDGGIFDQFTGATITPRAVVQAVRDALLYFRDHADPLLATPPPERPAEPQPLEPATGATDPMTPAGAAEVPGAAPAQNPTEIAPP